MTPRHLFCIGTSLTDLANVETVVDCPPSLLVPGGRIPLLPPIARRTLDNAVQRNGKVQKPIYWNALRLTSIEAMIAAWWGDYSVASADLYAVWVDESKHYSPFRVELERPVADEHYTDMNETFAENVLIPGYDWRLQVVRIDETATLTVEDRYVESDTTDAAVTLTLPAASTPNPYTPFRFKKVGGSNTLTLDGDGETIDGASTLVVASDVTIYSTGSAWRSTHRI